MSAVKIRIGEYAEDGSAVFEVDGVNIANAVRALRIEAGAQNLTTVTFDLACVEVDYDGPARVVMSKYSREMLLAHGWTPPVESSGSSSGAALEVDAQ